jgi:hypothetical protein
MTKISIALTAGALIATLSGAKANDTVGEFLRLCNGDRGDAGRVVCQNFAGGVGRQMFFTGAFAKKLRTYADQQVFKNWAISHPERWGDPAQAGINFALAQTWQCFGFFPIAPESVK